MLTGLATRLRPEYLLRPRQVLVRIGRAFGERPQSAVVGLPWRLPLEIRPRDRAGVSAAVWRSGVHDLPLSEALWRLTPRGGLAIDAGANIGYATGILALRVGNEGKVLAFEPMPSTAAILRRNGAAMTRAAASGAVVIRPVALSDRCGWGSLYAGPETVANPGVAHLSEETESTIPVELVTLDVEVSAPEVVSVLKIDVEGHELPVLQGAQRLLAEHRVGVIVYESFEARREAVEELLAGHGYTVFGLGRTLRGPCLVPRGSEPPRLGFEPPNYIATIEPDRVRAQMKGGGWYCLK